ncbi:MULTISPECIES: BglG family transcription antiterminator [Oceanobacillus]|uniref:BglG family transcription antiterminator n=2 Tax=Oceanobacillus TaxID=182709 RepID=A0ABV9JWZ7_9BACI|nr:PTS sugar transporter subunit IIA [Oceanobacillus oncorhynchi]MDM8100089.1 PTS sugar transporter subunit IIA [Oceanobacillus oncorhynchi]CEI82079.1 putative licABCH operon regulator [Oceanobacillus oncorhynchi]
MLSSRQKKILERLIEEEAFVSLADLNKAYQLSPRTIRQDLLEIETWLMDIGAGFSLERHRKYGARLILGEKQKQVLQEAMYKQKDYLSAVQRRQDMQKLLLLNSSIHVEELCEDYQISMNTLQNDYNQLKTEMEDYHLMLSRENKQISLVGEENNKRMLFLDFLKEQWTEEEILELYVTRRISASMNETDLEDMISDVDVHGVVSWIEQVEELSGIAFIDASKYELFLNCAVQWKRIQSGQFIADFDKDDELKIFEDEKFTAVREQFRRLMGLEDASLQLSNELAYISMHLLGARRLSGEGDYWLKCQSLSREIVETFEQANRFRLSNRENIIIALSTHLQSAMYRMKYHIHIDNPYFDNLEKEYRKYIEQVKAFIEKNPHWGLTTLHRHEIGFIVVHLCAGLEQEAFLPSKRIAIVCSSGLGTSRLLERTVRRLFPQVFITGQFSVKEAYGLTDKDADLIVTTVPFTQQLQVNHVKVNPLLSIADQQNLERIIGRGTYQANTELPIVETVMTIYQSVKKHTVVLNEGELFNDLYRYFSGNQGAMSSEVTSLTAPSCIHLREKVSDWREVLSILNQSLVKQDVVEHTYETEVAQIINEQEHHFIVAPGVAFPHLSSTAIKKTGFAFMTLEEPISFGGTEEKVWWIILLAAKDKIQHVTAVEMMLEVVNSKELLDKLRHERNIDVVWKWMLEYEEGSK